MCDERDERRDLAAEEGDEVEGEEVEVLADMVSQTQSDSLLLDKSQPVTPQLKPEGCCLRSPAVSNNQKNEGNSKSGFNGIIPSSV